MDFWADQVHLSSDEVGGGTSVFGPDVVTHAAVVDVILLSVKSDKYNVIAAINAGKKPMLNTHCLSVSIGQLQLQVPGAGK